MVFCLYFVHYSNLWMAVFFFDFVYLCFIKFTTYSFTSLQLCQYVLLFVCCFIFFPHADNFASFIINIINIQPQTIWRINVPTLWWSLRFYIRISSIFLVGSRCGCCFSFWYNFPSFLSLSHAERHPRFPSHTLIGVWK